jgi:hypothetical protein
MAGRVGDCDKGLWSNGDAESKGPSVRGVFAVDLTY